MNAAVPRICINKCDYINQVYELINYRLYNIEECYSKQKITLFDLLNESCTTPTIITIPNIITNEQNTPIETTCGITTSLVSITCNNIILTEV
jgi:hypothetical protein